MSSPAFFCFVWRGDISFLIWANRLLCIPTLPWHTFFSSCSSSRVSVLVFVELFFFFWNGQLDLSHLALVEIPNVTCFCELHRWEARSWEGGGFWR